MTALEYIRSLNPDSTSQPQSESEALEILIDSHKRMRDYNLKLNKDKYKEEIVEFLIGLPTKEAMELMVRAREGIDGTNHH